MGVRESNSHVDNECFRHTSTMEEGPGPCECSVVVEDITASRRDLFESQYLRRQYYLITPLSQWFFTRWFGNDDANIPKLTKWSRKTPVSFLVGLFLVYLGYKACMMKNQSRQITGYVCFVVGTIMSIISFFLTVVGGWAYYKFERQEKEHYIRSTRQESHENKLRGTNSRSRSASSGNNNNNNRRNRLNNHEEDERRTYYITSGFCTFIGKWFTDDDPLVPVSTKWSRPALIGVFFGTMITSFGVYLMFPNLEIYPHGASNPVTYWCGLGWLISGCIINAITLCSLVMGIVSYYLYQKKERVNYLRTILRHVAQISSNHQQAETQFNGNSSSLAIAKRNYGSISNGVTPNGICVTSLEKQDSLDRKLTYIPTYIPNTLNCDSKTSTGSSPKVHKGDAELRNNLNNNMTGYVANGFNTMTTDNWASTGARPKVRKADADQEVEWDETDLRPQSCMAFAVRDYDDMISLSNSDFGGVLEKNEHFANVHAAQSKFEDSCSESRIGLHEGENPEMVYPSTSSGYRGVSWLKEHHPELLTISDKYKEFNKSYHKLTDSSCD